MTAVQNIQDMYFSLKKGEITLQDAASALGVQEFVLADSFDLIDGQFREILKQQEIEKRKEYLHNFLSKTEEIVNIFFNKDTNCFDVTISGGKGYGDTKNHSYFVNTYNEILKEELAYQENTAFDSKTHYSVEELASLMDETIEVIRNMYLDCGFDTNAGMTASGKQIQMLVSWTVGFADFIERAAKLQVDSQTKICGGMYELLDKSGAYWIFKENEYKRMSEECSF